MVVQYEEEKCSRDNFITSWMRRLAEVQTQATGTGT